MQVEQFFGEDLERAMVVQLGDLLLGQEEGIVGGVDRLGDPEDAVRDGQAPTEGGRILDVIKPNGKTISTSWLDDSPGVLLRTARMRCGAA